MGARAEQKRERLLMQRRELQEAAVRRIAAIAAGTQARRYLEVGVARGGTFRRVAVPEKHGVDPAFAFDVAEIETAQVRCFEMDSDRYFAELPLDTTFDIIYLDGLHTFEQTYRDLCSALHHAHPGTVILLDDTVPVSELSALRNQELARSAQLAVGGRIPFWHGDVFKVVFAIHDFHPSLNYITIGRRGKGQTLVWQSTSFRRAPLLDSFTAIEALTFADFNANARVFRYLPEAEGIAACLANLRAIGAIS